MGWDCRNQKEAAKATANMQAWTAFKQYMQKMWPWSSFSLNLLEIAGGNQQMSLFVKEMEKLTYLVSEKGTRLIETLEIDILYFRKSHLCYNALCLRTSNAPLGKGTRFILGGTRNVVF